MHTATATSDTAISAAVIAKHVRAVSDAHDKSDTQIIRSIRTVNAAVRDGLTVKFLASEMTAAAVSDPTIRPVTATTLGYANGVLTVLDKLGISLKSAPSSLQVACYRAIMRHGISASVKRIAGAGVEGGTEPAEKAAAAEAEADAITAEHKSARKAREGGKPAADAEPAHVMVSDRAAALATIAGEISRGAYVPTPEFLAALDALTGEVSRVVTRNYAAAPVRVPVLKAVGA